MVRDPKNQFCARYCNRSSLLSLRAVIDQNWILNDSESDEESVSPRKVADCQSGAVDAEVGYEESVSPERPAIGDGKVRRGNNGPSVGGESDVLRLRDTCELVRNRDNLTRRFASPFACYGTIDIKPCDLACLDDGNWLNDVIVDFYMEYLLVVRMGNRLSNRVFYLSSLASSAVQRFDRRSSRGEDAVREAYRTFEPFTKNVDIFAKDFILFPLSLSFHWILVIICYPNWLDVQRDLQLLPDRRTCILIFDSFGTSSSCSATAQRLRSLLEAEWKAKKDPLEVLPFTSASIPARSMRVPLQQNCSDCGLFVLHYAELFLECLSGERKFSLSEFCRSDLREWFPPSDIEQKRRYIRNLVLKLPTA